MSEPETQSTGSWTEFNIKICSELPVIYDTVPAYYPRSCNRNVPPNEMIQQMFHIMQALKIDKTVCLTSDFRLRLQR